MDASIIADVDISNTSPHGSARDPAREPAATSPIHPEIVPATTPTTSGNINESTDDSSMAVHAKETNNMLLAELSNMKHLLKSSRVQIRKFKALLKPLAASAKIYLSKQNVPILLLYNKYKVQVDTLIKYIFAASKPHIPAKIRKIVSKWMKPACK